MSIYPTTIVTCYYPLPSAKHDISFYQHWVTNFLTNVNTPIVFFSDAPTIRVLSQIREAVGLGQTICFVEKPFDDLKFSSPEWIDRWNKQVELSSFRHLHNHELFRVWANKSFFVEEAIKLNPFGSDFFVWCDAGCWRDYRVARVFGKDWPSENLIKANCIHILNLTPVDEYMKEVLNPEIQTHEDVVVKIQTSNKLICGGTILVGDKAAWQTWIPTFETTLDLFVKNNLFAGDDQAVLVSTGLWLFKSQPEFAPVFIQAPSSPGYVEINGEFVGDQWFYFQIYFSQLYHKNLCKVSM